MININQKPGMNDFLFLNTTGEKKITYLDSAATMQIPNEVIEEVTSFYQYTNANIHRGIYARSEHATKAYENTRALVCEFLGVNNSDEIIFTSGTTAAVNMVAGMLESRLSPSDEIMITQMEHHSNYLPWVELAKRSGAKLVVIPVLKNGGLDLKAFEEALNHNTKMVSFTEVSNVTGIRNPVEVLTAMVREKSEAYVLVDGAQGVCHGRLSLAEYEPDFYAFSGHKLGAPTGIGVLYMKQSLQEEFSPVYFGGGMAEYSTGPGRYEAGTPNIAGAIGLGAAIRYFMKKEKAVDANEILEGGRLSPGMDLLDALKSQKDRELSFLADLENELEDIPGITILAKGEKHYGCLSFVVEDLSAYDVSKLLDAYGICVRSGHLCAKPYLKALGLERVVRVSVAMYTEKADLEYFIKTLKEVLFEYRALEEFKKKDHFCGKTIGETEALIMKELDSLKDKKEQSLYLAKLGEQCMSFPMHFDRSGYDVNECQAHTTIISGWKDEHFVFYADSDTNIIRGILFLLQQLFVGRTKEEMRGFECRLLEHPVIKSEGEFLKKRISAYINT